MNEIQTVAHVFNTQTVRTVIINGEPWWVGADVCAALGIKNSRDALAAIPENEKGVGLVDTLGGPQKMTIINEPGLYRLILRSNKPAAEEFATWIFHEVLPSIRRTGTYTQNRPVPVMDNFRMALENLEAATRAAGAFGLTGNQALMAGNSAIRNYYDVDPAKLLGITHLYQPEQERVLTVTEVGMRLSISPANTNKLLEAHGYQTSERDHRGRSVWTLTEKGKQFGRLFDTEKVSGGTPVLQLKWLEGIVPVLEGEEGSEEKGN